MDTSTGYQKPGSQSCHIHSEVKKITPSIFQVRKDSKEGQLNNPRIGNRETYRKKMIDQELKSENEKSIKRMAKWTCERKKQPRAKNAKCRTEEMSRHCLIQLGPSI